MNTQFILLSQVIWSMTLFGSCRVDILHATLTCNISNSEPSVYNISWNDLLHNCTATCLLNNTQEYNVRCINEYVQITIINVSRGRNGEVWTCGLNVIVNAGSAKDKSLSSSINDTPKIVGGIFGSAILIAGLCICVWILRKRLWAYNSMCCDIVKSEETNQTNQAVLDQPRDSSYEDMCTVPNTETGTAATDSRGSSTTTSASGYVEMSTVENDAKIKHQSLNNEETTVDYENLKI